MSIFNTLITGMLCRNENVTNDYTDECSGRTKQDLIQTLWPDHCVKNTTDARIHNDLYVADTDIVVRKGYQCQVHY